LNDPGYSEQRHQQVLEQLHRLNVGVESLNVGLDRQSRLLADISAKVEAALRFLIQKLAGTSRLTWGAVMPDEPERWTEAVASYGPVFLLAARRWCCCPSPRWRC
jgi:hypothetical protein